jgi:hypothetical protein
MEVKLSKGRDYMAKTRISVSGVNNIYSGRTSPSSKVWTGDCDGDAQKPQFAEDQHSKGYCPTVSPKSWLRSDGTKRPGFDHSPKRDSERR